MLPLHTTLKNVICFSLATIILLSCKSVSENDLTVTIALQESIESSSQMLAESSKEITTAFEERLRDPASSERAKIWLPKIKKVQQLSSDVFNYVESIKKDMVSNSNFSLELFEELMKYKKNILQIDPKITQEFQKSIKIFTRTIDSSATNQKKIFQNHFDNVSTISALAMLNKLQNNIRVIEEKVIAFCYEQSSRLIIGPCIIDWPIVGLNSTIVQAGERIEIFAGVGEFRSDMKCEIFIYGKQVKLKDNAVAHYRLKAASKPGKYYVPVKINYTDQDGRQQTLEKEIEYIVANIQKQ